MLIDDYDLVAPGGGAVHPLLPIVEFLPQAKDVGLHVIVARRCGRYVTLTARCHDRRGDFEVRTKCTTLADAFHELARLVSVRLHDQLLTRAVA